MINQRFMAGLVAMLFAASLPGADVIRLADLRQIVVSKSAHARERSMARVLQRELKNLYGTNPTIVQGRAIAEGAGTTVLVGRELAIDSKLIRDAEFEALKFDGYVMRGNGRRIVIAGYAPQGTVFGTWAFLKRAGLKVYPNRDFDGLEIRDPLPDGMMPAFDVSSRPFFENRDLLGHLDRGRWGATFRELGGMGDFGFARNHEWFKPRGWLGGDHTAPYLVPMGKYGREHPEYFALRGKERIPRNTPNVRTTICMSNPDVHRIAAERALEWMGIQSASRFFYITDGDARACRCEPCRALDPLPKIVSDRKLRWVNSVARTVKNKFPDNIVIALAYGENTKAAVSTIPESNVVILYCPWLWNSRATSAVSWANPQNITAMKEFMDLAMRFPGQIGVYDYPGNWVQGQAERIKFLARNNARVFHGNGGSGDLFQWVSINLLWDPFLDIEPLIDEFVAAAYGPAAGPMREWERIKQRAIDENVVHTRDPFTTPEFINAGRKALAKAIDLSGSADEKTRVRILREVLAGYQLLLRKTHPVTGVTNIRSTLAAFES